MIVDIVSVVVLLASIAISILRGFVREVLTIFGIAGGAVASYVGGPLLIPYMKSWLGVGEEDAAQQVVEKTLTADTTETAEVAAVEAEKFMDIIPYPLLAEGLSYTLVFVVFVIILSVISHYLAESVKNFGLGAVDRTLGMVFGLVRGVLFLGLLYLPVYYLVEEEQMQEWDWLQSSKSRIYMDVASGWIAEVIPEQSVDSMSEAMNDMDAMNSARKKLQDMDLLKSEDETGQESGEDSELEGAVPEGEQGAEAGEADEANKGAQGYTDTFRSEMDKLIERTTGQ
ncbi:MAG: CvpA family protein [Alphaproteobacteria bacterium]